MKKYILILFIFITSFLCFGISPPIMTVATDGIVADPCETAGCTGTYLFCSTNDYESDTDTACVNSGATTKAGTASGATIDTWANFGIAGCSGCGTYGIKIDANDEFVSYDVSSDDIANDQEGTIMMNLYFSATTNNNNVFGIDANNGGQDYMQANSRALNTFYARHTGNYNYVLNDDDTATISDTTWTKVYIAWSVINNKVSIKIGAGGWHDDPDPTAVTAFSTGTFKVYLGDNPVGQGVTDAFYIGDVYISGTFQDTSH